MKPMTEEQRQRVADRLNENRYVHGMRSRLDRDMVSRFIREQKAQATANEFNKVFTERSDLKVKCIMCGAPMEAQRSTKRTCSARCRTRLSRLVRATTKAQVEKRLAERMAEDEREDHTRLSRVARAERPAGNGDEGRFVLVDKVGR